MQVHAHRRAFHLVEAMLLCEFLADDEVLLVLAASVGKVGGAFYYRHAGVSRAVRRIEEAHREVAAVVVAEAHEAGEVAQPLQIVSIAAVAPALLGVVEAEEIGEQLEKLLEDAPLQVVVALAVSPVARAAAQGLHHRPHTVLGAHSEPRLRRGVSVGGLHEVALVVGGGREGDVEYHERADVLGHEVDYRLRVGIVPCVDVYEPRRLLGRNPPAQRACRLYQRLLPRRALQLHARQLAPQSERYLRLVGHVNLVEHAPHRATLRLRRRHGRAAAGGSPISVAVNAYYGNVVAGNFHIHQLPINRPAIFAVNQFRADARIIRGVFHLVAQSRQPRPDRERAAVVKLHSVGGV